MNKLKEQYCSPTTNILVVRFEGMLMQSGFPKAGGAGQAGANDSYNAYDEDF